MPQVSDGWVCTKLGLSGHGSSRRRCYRTHMGVQVARMGMEGSEEGERKNWQARGRKGAKPMHGHTCRHMHVMLLSMSKESGSNR